MSFTPHSLSKEKLKTELLAHNIPLPPSAAKKDVYVHLYEKHVMTAQKSQKTTKEKLSEFSSDEDDSFKTSKTQQRQRTIFTSNNENNDSNQTMVVDGFNISQLTDDELRQRLINFNQIVGPILATTRTVYERKLARLLQGEMEGEVTNGRFRSEEYSDSDEEGEVQISPQPSSSQQSNSTHSLRSSKKVVEEKKSTQVVEEEPEIVPTRRQFSRETPTPRRSFRADVSYTPIDKKLYADLIHRNTQMGSKVTEEVETEVEPSNKICTTKAKGMSWFLKLTIFLLGVGFIIALIYYNMEGNDLQEIGRLPGHKIKN